MTNYGKWLSIVGITEEGLDSLPPVARFLLQQAEVIAGGRRHLQFLPKEDTRKKIVIQSPLENCLQEIETYRGKAVCVLASGDPMWYGIGVTLCRRFPLEEITIIPSPSVFSLACARLGWSLSEVETVSLCGRNPSLLHRFLYPQARLLILSTNGRTPLQVASLLTQKGYGKSEMVVLECLGSKREKILRGMACQWHHTDLADLNTIAVVCHPDSPTTPILNPRLPGLPDEAYLNDGQLTKREIRAITLSNLSPLPYQLLWDVGAGCGSISIEWLRSDSRCQAIAIEKHPQRLHYIADNAIALGTPHLQIIAGSAPDALHNLPSPDAIFIGGGITTPQLVETCWHSLKPGGKLVANVVTVEGEEILYQCLRQWGGSLIRLAIQKATPLGNFLSWKPMTPVTQYVVVKP